MEAGTRRQRQRRVLRDLDRGLEQIDQVGNHARAPGLQLLRLDFGVQGRGQGVRACPGGVPPEAWDLEDRQGGRLLVDGRDSPCDDVSGERESCDCWSTTNINHGDFEECTESSIQPFIVLVVWRPGVRGLVGGPLIV
jgi:hypothetical protein